MSKLHSPNVLIALLLILCSTVFSQSYPIISEAMSVNTATIEDEDKDTPDWVEIYNPSSQTILLNNYYLSDDENDKQKWNLPNIELNAKSYILIFASGKFGQGTSRYNLHTNFKINSDGEELFLSKSSEIIDRMFVPALRANHSAGRESNGEKTVKVFEDPTPKSANITTAYDGYAPSVKVSAEGGFYGTAQQIIISSISNEATIRYTLDGAIPGSSSTIYSSAISVSSTKVLRCRAFENNKIPGLVATHTYFINEIQNLPIVSLSTDPDNFFDDDIGIYVKGNSNTMGGYASSPTGPPANFWEDWERPVHLELYEMNGELAFSIDAGVKMFGKGSRKNDQKSLAVFLRSEYGRKSLDYQLFPSMDITSFKSFLLRNAGSDNVQEDGAHFRDGLTASLVQNLGIEKQAYRPSVLYINGEYWGIYGIREKNNEDMLANHHDINPKEVDILDDYHTLYPLVVEGESDLYDELLDYLKEYGARSDEDAEFISSIMQVENFFDYMVTQIFITNQDGPWHNCKFWRPQSPEGKFRWLLYDTDLSFCGKLFNSDELDNEAYKDNTLYYYLVAGGSGWPNPDASTFLLRTLIQNKKFKTLLTNRFADRLNTIFKEEVSTQIADSIIELLDPEMETHTDRWYGSKNKWHSDIDEITTFLNLRPEYLRDIIIDEFNLDGTVDLTFNISPSNAGTIQLNSLKLRDDSWKGIYFKNVPIDLTALANPGYRFAGWTGLENNADVKTSTSPSKDLTITAKFEKIDDNSPYLQINEICYVQANENDTDDWIELYNPYGIDIDITNWKIQRKRDAAQYVMPENTVIKANDYLVVCRSKKAFKLYYPGIPNKVGNMDFGINKFGETLVLLNAENEVIDLVSFTNTAPWPELPENSGYIIALHPDKTESSNSWNWGISLRYGTPGAINEIDIALSNKVDEVFASHDKYKQKIYPNPFVDYTNIEFELATTEHVQVKVFDVEGRLVSNLENSILQPGKHTLTLDGQLLTNGFYFVKMIIGSDVITEKSLVR